MNRFLVPLVAFAILIPIFVIGLTRNPNEILKELSQSVLKSHGEELARLVKFLVRSRTPGPVPSGKQDSCVACVVGASRTRRQSPVRRP